MNSTFTPDSKLSYKICEEVNQKIATYESRMTNRLARWVEAAELYSGKTSTNRENSKLSPNSAELYKAVRAISNMQYRMLTSQKPFFELCPLDILGHADPAKILKSEHYVTNQLELSRFGKGLLRTLNQLGLYGSVAIHKQYEPLRASFLGTKRYVTSFRPISLINCAFSLDAYDIEESGWVGLSDIQAKSALYKLEKHDPVGKVYNLKGLHDALNDKDYQPKVNTWVTQRMAWSGYFSTSFVGGIERVTYYGPLECQDDGEEYCVEIVNRQHIIRMEAYEGIRPVSVATVDTIDVEPLGNGLADHFRPQLQQIDDVSSSLLNTITLAGANMFKKQKSLTDEDAEFAIRTFGIASLENPADFGPLGPDPRTVLELNNAEDRYIQKFRQASGATDTLQALVQGDSATATEVSLSMNEAVRNISVGAEVLAPVIISDHIKVILQNAQKYNTQPFTLTIGKTPIEIMPADLMIDVDVRIKTMTDQDFRPAKVKNLLTTLQVMGSMPPDTIPGYRTNPGPALLELLKMLDVPDFANSVQPITDEDMLRMRMMAEMQNPQQGGEENEEQETGAERRINSEKAGRKEARVLNRDMSMPMAESGLKTPVGPVLGVPGDNQSSTQAVRSATVEK